MKTQFLFLLAKQQSITVTVNGVWSIPSLTHEDLSPMISHSPPLSATCSYMSPYEVVKPHKGRYLSPRAFVEKSFPNPVTAKPHCAMQFFFKISYKIVQYRNIIDFCCSCIKKLAKLIKSSNLSVQGLVISTHIIPFIINDSFISYFLIITTFVSFSYLLHCLHSPVKCWIEMVYFLCLISKETWIMFFAVSLFRHTLD